MRVITFEPYLPDDKKAPATVQRAWIIMYTAVAQCPCGDRKNTATLYKVVNAIKDISDVVNVENGNEFRRLKPAGPELVLEDVEWQLLEKAVEDFRKGIRGGDSDALFLVDTLIHEAKTVSRKQYEQQRQTPGEIAESSATPILVPRR